MKGEGKANCEKCSKIKERNLFEGKIKEWDRVRSKEGETGSVGGGGGYVFSGI